MLKRIHKVFAWMTPCYSNGVRAYVNVFLVLEMYIMLQKENYSFLNYHHTRTHTQRVMLMYVA